MTTKEKWKKNGMLLLNSMAHFIPYKYHLDQWQGTYVYQFFGNQMSSNFSQADQWNKIYGSEVQQCLEGYNILEL